MKIALLTDGIYPYVIGGMQKHSFYLAKYLARAGHIIDLYHFNASDRNIHELELFSEEERKNINSIVLRFPEMKGVGHYMRESYEYSRMILNEMEKRPEVDFVYAKGFTGWELINLRSKGKKFPPVGVNLHGYEMFQKAPSFKSMLQSRFLLQGPAMFNMKNADTVFSYGGRITELLLKLGIEKNKIIEIPAGIDENWVREEGKLKVDKVRFVFIGRWERRKGVEELNLCLKKLLASNAEFEMNFIGPVPAKMQLISDKIVYHGVQREREQIMQILSGANVLVCPSHSEGMPNVILEAMASGLAVIATDTGAVKLMVDGSNGWCITPGNSSELLKVMQSAISEKNSLAEKGKCSLIRVKEKFLWENIATQTVQKIEGLLSRN